MEFDLLVGKHFTFEAGEHTISAVVSALRSEMKPGYTVNLDVNGVFELREVDEEMPDFTLNLSRLAEENRMEEN